MLFRSLAFCFSPTGYHFLPPPSLCSCCSLSLEGPHLCWAEGIRVPAPLAGLGFSRQEDWSGLPLPSTLVHVFSQASASAASHDIGCSSAAHSKPVTHLELTRFFPQSQTFLGLTHLAECSVLDMGPEPSIKRDLNHGSRTLEAGRV